MRDISERKMYEESLKVSNERYNALIQTTTDGFCVLDLEGNILEVNDSYYKMIGYSKEQLLHMKIKDIDYLQSEGDTKKLIEQITKNGWARFESKHKCANGVIIDVEVSTTFLEHQNIMIAFINDTTARKLDEYKLRENEDRFKYIFDNSVIGKSITYLTGEVNVNNSFCEMIGYTNEELRGKKWQEITYPDDIELTQRNMEKMLSGEKDQFRFTKRYLHKNGSIIWTELTSGLRRDSNGIPLYYITTIRDITESKRAEEEIKHNENYLKSLVLILQHDSDSVQEFLDFALHETLRLTSSKLGYIYHYSEEKKEFILSTWSKEVMKQCSVLEQKTVYQLDQTGLWGEAVRQRKPIIVNDFQASHNLKKGYPDGHAQLHKYMTLPVFSNDKIVGVVGVANKEMDYTEADVLHLSLLMNSVWKVVDRKHSEEELNESRARFSATIEQSNDGISIADLDGNYLEVNPKFCSMTGYTRDELLKMRVSDLVPRKAPSILFSQVTKEKKSGHREGKLIRKDGTTFFALVTGSLIKVEDKYYVQGIVRDITDRKLVEFELEKHRNHLEELVKLRTQQLSDVNNELTKKIQKEEEYKTLLQQSLEKEIELNEIKSRFISTTSHEFRTPLTSILSSTGLLKRYSGRWDDDKKNEHFERIENSVTYLVKLLDDILTISHADSGRINYEPALIDFKQLVKECVFDAQNISASHHIKLSFNPSHTEYLLDQKLMRFILNNLLSNAIKYSPGTKNVKVSISTIDNNLVIEVSDEGIGIPKEEIDNIFESFYRTKNAGDIKGTGLGLAIVKRAVELHGGGISVLSELNIGTTFIVKIPV